MDDADAILTTATNPDGSWRFYAPYEHPATAHLRRYRDQLEAFPESEARDEALDHVKRQLATFEHGEDRAKRDYLRARRGR